MTTRRCHFVVLLFLLLCQATNTSSAQSGSATQSAFQKFWREFKTAFILKDEAKIRSMTADPFLIYDSPYPVTEVFYQLGRYYNLEKLRKAMKTTELITKVTGYWPGDLAPEVPTQLAASAVPS